MCEKPLDLEEVRKEVFKWVSGNYMKELEECYDFTMGEIKQRIKKACEFYLRYKDNPELFVSHFKGKGNKKIEEELEKEFRRRYNYNTKDKELVRQMRESKTFWMIVPSYKKRIDTIELNEYNKWLFKLAFKDVLEEGERK